MSAVWWMKDCDGPYAVPCLELYESDIAAHNLRLYQWCGRCLSELSIRLGGQVAGEEMPERPKLVKRPFATNYDKPWVERNR